MTAPGATRETAALIVFGTAHEGDGWWRFTPETSGVAVVLATTAEVYDQYGNLVTSGADNFTVSLIGGDEYAIYATGGLAVGALTYEWGEFLDGTVPNFWAPAGLEGATGQRWNTSYATDYVASSDATMIAEFEKALIAEGVVGEQVVSNLLRMNVVTDGSNHGADASTTNYQSTTNIYAFGVDARSAVLALPEIETWQMPPGAVQAEYEAGAGTFTGEASADIVFIGQRAEDGPTMTAQLRALDLTLDELNTPRAYDATGPVVLAYPVDDTSETATVDLTPFCDPVTGRVVLCAAAVVLAADPPPPEESPRFSLLSSWDVGVSYGCIPPRVRYLYQLPILDGITPPPPDPEPELWIIGQMGPSRRRFKRVKY